VTLPAAAETALPAVSQALAGYLFEARVVVARAVIGMTDAE